MSRSADLIQSQLKQNLNELSPYAQYVLKKEGFDLNKKINEYKYIENKNVMIQLYAGDTLNITFETPLSCMTRKSEFVVVRELLNASADPTLKDSAGNTPLFYASRQEQFIGVGVVNPNLLETLKLLLDSPVDNLLLSPINKKGEKILDRILCVYSPIMFPDPEKLDLKQIIPANFHRLAPTKKDCYEGLILRKIAETIFFKNDSQEQFINSTYNNIPKDISNLVADYSLDIKKFLGHDVLKVLADDKEALKLIESCLFGWREVVAADRKVAREMEQRIASLEKENKNLKQRLEGLSKSVSPSTITTAYEKQAAIKNNNQVSKIKPNRP